MTKQYAPIVNGKQYAVPRAVRKYYKNVDVYDYFKYEYEPWVQPVTAETRTVVNGTAEDYDYREHVGTGIAVSTADDYDFYKDETIYYGVKR